MVLASIYIIHVVTILATLQPIFRTKPFICRFSSFYLSCGEIYHLGGDMPLNRKYERNNFRVQKKPLL